MNKQSEKLDALSERIRQAQAGAEAKKEALKSRSAPTRNAGIDFGGAIIGSGILGFLMDRGFGTMPWCMVGMVLFGFVAGIVSAWRTMQQSADEDN